MTVSLEPGDQQDSLCQRAVYTVNEQWPREPNAVYAPLHVLGCPVRFQVDTGRSCNVIRAQDSKPIKDIFLIPTNKFLRMYDGSKTRTNGLCTVIQRGIPMYV